ncbi:P-loop containing nucleoside triphosphate hydrolase protein [Cantharellus anzutake]|uniref:P-loop containing nucleoside triphosphate hydrolase protein n=1 Tax=Cantharellus anzutake TaxID=1750568 RepID=UPI001905AEC2|nr:P-loop containing nucleoside triphosphate hydrolase protein [Cantharellus anzutake]KAF8335696.1 P-loop containing nucleoside triphosphate hydrolase protein [Cantharellus anzutake]
MRAAESDWLQEPESSSAPESPPVRSGRLGHEPWGRFDWKSKLLQRNRRLLNNQLHDQHPTRPLRRYKPASVELRPDMPYFEEIDRYIKRYDPLLIQEQSVEDEAYLERLREWPLEKLIEEGYCLTGLSAFWLEATQFGKPVAVFSLGPGKAIYCSPGRQVILSRSHPSEDGAIVGTVLLKTSTQIRIVFDKKEDIEDGTWRLDITSTDISFQRMRAAIYAMTQDIHDDAFHSNNSAEAILHGTALRDALLNGFKVKTLNKPNSSSAALDDYPTKPHGIFSANQTIHSWAVRYQRENPIAIEGDPKLDLNPPQIRAIACMIGQKISLIQGPPGTGKTRTLIEALKLLKKHFGVPIPILVCTYTNVAADHILEGLVECGLQPLRVGSATRVRPHLHPYTLDARIEGHRHKKAIDRYRDELNHLERKLQLAYQRNDEDGLESLKEKVNACRGKKYRLEQTMLQEIISNAEVVCTTSITSASAALQVIDFPVVFIDEASMSTEPASLIPIMRGSHHISLIGDHKQLPPIIRSEDAKAGGLAISLFERLMTEGNVPTVMLDRQYRMHPSISKFPSKEFYGTRLLDGTVDSKGQVSAKLNPPKSSHLVLNPSTGNSPSAVFLDHGGPEARKDRSLVNHNEAAIVCSVVVDLLLNNPSIRGLDIGVIAPYAAQIKFIERMLTNDDSYQGHFVKILGRHRALECSLIEVKTVDGFEGREKDIIIFSTVRNNQSGHIGFLADRRRLNVGLTRARRGLFVIGNMRTLRAGKVGFFQEVGETAVPVRTHPVHSEIEGQVWRRFIDFMAAQNLVKNVHSHLLIPQSNPELPVATTAAVS